jgi:Family of unknown function (DUF6152)
MLNHTQIAGFVVAALALPLAANAHHSFSAEFDLQKAVHIEGVVVKMDWVNPHSWLYIDVTKPDGKVDHWMVEGGAPSALLRRGWNRNSLPAGTKIVVDGFQARDGALRANARDIIFPDGRTLSLGSSNTAEADKDSDKAQKSAP